MGSRKNWRVRPRAVATLPTCFLLECYNPESHKVQLSLTMRATDEHAMMPFQKLISLTPGLHRIRVPLEEIAGFLDLQQPFGIDLIPNDEAHETTLYFGLMEFVTESAESQMVDQAGQNGEPTENDKKVKCVVWDLDNTMWEGVLVEDGLDRLRLKPDVSKVIQALDQRGILLSIASKNNAEDALQAVKKFGLDQYFLCPQISWGPKSQGLKTIAQQLNIGMDSILFVDDSEFELGEVQAVCPEVRVLNADAIPHSAGSKRLHGSGYGRKPGTAQALSGRSRPADGGAEFQQRLLGIS